MDLIIKNVPDDKDVVTEILTNAETTIKNYHAKLILTIPVEKQLQYEQEIDNFKSVNTSTLEKYKVEEVLETNI